MRNLVTRIPSCGNALGYFNRGTVGAHAPVEGTCAPSEPAAPEQLSGRIDAHHPLANAVRITRTPEMPPRVTRPSSHIGVLARIALLVAIGDWLTKAVASTLVGPDAVVFTDRLRFAVVHNDGAAFGLSAGAYTWPLNLALTLAAIVLMVAVARDLARIDDAAPRALGLIMGGAMGNLASLLLGPPGVVDFISV